MREREEMAATTHTIEMTMRKDEMVAEREGQQQGLGRERRGKFGEKNTEDRHRQHMNEWKLYLLISRASFLSTTQTVTEFGIPLFRFFLPSCLSLFFFFVHLCACLQPTHNNIWIEKFCRRATHIYWMSSFFAGCWQIVGRDIVELCPPLHPRSTPIKYHFCHSYRSSTKVSFHSCRPTHGRPIVVDELMTLMRIRSKWISVWIIELN